MGNLGSLYDILDLNLIVINVLNINYIVFESH